MKAKVLNLFKDKETKELFTKDSVYEGEPNRVKELQRLGYLGEVTEEEKQPSILDSGVEEVKDAITSDINVDELQKLLEDEEANKNRKSVKEHIEKILAELEEEGE